MSAVKRWLSSKAERDLKKWIEVEWVILSGWMQSPRAFSNDWFRYSLDNYYIPTLCSTSSKYVKLIRCFPHRLMLSVCLIECLQNFCAPQLNANRAHFSLLLRLIFTKIKKKNEECLMNDKKETSFFWTLETAADETNRWMDIWTNRRINIIIDGWKDGWTSDVLNREKDEKRYDEMYVWKETRNISLNYNFFSLLTKIKLYSIKNFCRPALHCQMSLYCLPLMAILHAFKNLPYIPCLNRPAAAMAAAAAVAGRIGSWSMHLRRLRWRLAAVGAK